MKQSDLSYKVFADRYSLKDKAGKPVEHKVEEMWKRVAKAVSGHETKDKQKEWEKEFYFAMKDFKYVPAGRILSGAGTGYEVMFYNCFVIPSPQDSRSGILETLNQMVEIMARSGGVGVNLSSLRPRGARVNKVNGFSSGPCNWSELFSVATKDIVQQGGSRRGALMIMLWDWHPDIEEFITVKQDLHKINGANLSLAISDDFMKAVKNDEDWPLIFPDTQDPQYDELWRGDMKEWKALGKKIKVHKVVKARKIWDMIAEAAWKSAEPGVVFMDRCNTYYNNWYWNRVNCVNPCGEEPLPAWGVCNLGSINLSALVKSADITKKGRFDFALLKRLVRTAVRFQDNLIDMNPYFYDQIREVQKEGERRIGVGTMGLGDALIKLHMKYGSEDSLEFIDKVYKIMRDEAYRASSEIAKEKGSFKKFDQEKYLEGAFIKQLPQDVKKDIKEQGIRNSLLLTQAPTGSTSLLADSSSGIEPIFEFEFIRNDRLGQHIVRHPLYEAWYKKNEKEIKDGTVKRPKWFVSANDLSPEDHVKVQAVIQKYIDASISKTCNAPNSHTVEDVKKLYTMAYDLGLKGITYFRDGSRPGVLERAETPKETQKVAQPAVKPRPMVVKGATYKMKTPVGTAYITINTDDQNEPHEVFINGVGKAGTDLYAMAEGLGRMISLCFRLSSHLPPADRVRRVIDEMKDIGGSMPTGFGKDRIKSLPDAIAKVLAMHFMLNGHASKEKKEELEDAARIIAPESVQPSLMEAEHKIAGSADICSECGAAALINEEGCAKCYNCGYARC